MKTFLLCILILFFYCQIPNAFGQSKNPYKTSDQIIKHLKELSANTDQFDKSEIRHIPKKPGYYSPEDWREVIDETWGEGLPTAEKLEIFDYFWNKIDDEYANFFNANINWDSLYNHYRPEIEAGVSRGRFFGIMGQLNFELADIHTNIMDWPVAYSELNHGIPLFVANGFRSAIYALGQVEDYSHFGAGLSPLPDSSLLVYGAAENHPLGIQPGDIVLGYDGKPWKEIYKELLEAELPFSGWSLNVGTNPESKLYDLLTSAGENWHLFDVIDIIKYTSGDTVHLSTQLMEQPHTPFIASAQLPINGVPFPDYKNGHHVSWGIVSGTNIGYIYVWSWGVERDGLISTGDEFRQAILSFINEYKVSGLIIDSRFNIGGELEFLKGLKILFNQDQKTYIVMERSNADDHFAMQQVTYDANVYADNYLFDRPIALLTGPGSVSAGDLMPLQTSYHPMCKTFGMTTSGSFNQLEWLGVNDMNSYWYGIYSISNAHLVENPGEYLARLSQPPDKKVSFTKEDVAKGEDTVVKTAIEWINNLAYSHDVFLSSPYIKPNEQPVQLTAQVENPNENLIFVTAYIYTDSTMVDSVYLSEEGAEGDSLWGATWLPTEEDIYKVSVKTDDPIASTSRTLPNVTYFTSAGPMVFDRFEFTGSDTILNAGDSKDFKIALKNEGLSKTLTDISVKIFSDDSLIFIESNSTFNSILPGESIFCNDTSSLTVASDHPVGSALVRLDISSNGNFYWSDSFYIDIVTGIAEKVPTVPVEFALHQNYPNPFNPKTTIKYELPNTNYVNLSIYNLLGQKVVTLVNKKQPVGKHKVEWDASEFASGLYFYRLETAKGFVQSRKLILLK